MAIALHDLGGKYRRFEPEPFAHCSFDARIDMRVRAHRAADLANTDALPRLREALMGTSKFIKHQSQL